MDSPPNAEALIREARRLRRRRWAVGVVIVVLVGAVMAIVGSNLGSRAPQATTSADGPSPGVGTGSRSSNPPLARIQYATEMGVLGIGEVWAVDGFHFYLTRNDGKSWLILKAPDLGGDVVAHVESVAAVGRNDLWIATSQKRYGACGHPSLPSPTSGAYGTSAIDISTNGGGSWTQSTLPNCADADRLTFINPNDGWALSESFGTGLPTSTGIYATDNGGRSWRLIATPPFAGPIAFASTSDGWGVQANAAGISGNQPLAVGGELYRTTDGGASWIRAVMPEPTSLIREGLTAYYGAPDFIGGGIGFIPVLFSRTDAAAARFGLYATTNGGKSWALHLTPDDPGIAAYSPSNDWPGLAVWVPWSALNRSDWFIYVGPKLYITNDAGRTWHSLTPRPSAIAPGIESATFTSKSAGWALFGEGPGETRLARTTDGGSTWRYAT